MAQRSQHHNHKRSGKHVSRKKLARRRRKLLREIREWIITLAISLLIVILIRSFAFTVIRVDGRSMQPTLQNGERLFVTVYDAKFGEIERGDVVICHYPNRGGDYFVKRVVAVPGDSVYRKDFVTHVVYANETEAGTQIIDSELDPAFESHSSHYNNDYDPYVLGADEYFVVGDNRYDSHDSRDWQDVSDTHAVGPITRSMIVGHVRHVIWPPDNVRPVQ